MAKYRLAVEIKVHRADGVLCLYGVKCVTIKLNVQLPQAGLQEVKLSRREAAWSAEASRGKKTVIVWLLLNRQSRPALV